MAEKTKLFNKDPDSILDYTVDWGIHHWLQTGEVIVTSTWTLESGLTSPLDASFTESTTTVWITGGTVGQELTATNHIVTDAGREEDAVLVFRINDRF